VTGNKTKIRTQKERNVIQLEREGFDDESEGAANLPPELIKANLAPEI